MPKPPAAYASPLAFESIPFRHPAYPRKAENPRHADAMSGSAFFVHDSRTGVLLGRIWHNTQRERTPGCWTWTLHFQKRSEPLGAEVQRGHADSKDKAGTALRYAWKRWDDAARSLLHKLEESTREDHR